MMITHNFKKRFCIKVDAVFELLSSFWSCIILKENHLKNEKFKHRYTFFRNGTHLH